MRDRAPRPSSTARSARALVAASPPARSLRAAQVEAVVRRTAHRGLAPSPGRTSSTVNGPSGVGSSQPSAPCTTKARSIGRPGKRLGHELRGGQIERAGELEQRRRGIRERPQDVEHRAHAHGLADRRHGLHGRVVVRREQERELRGREARAGGGFVERQFEPELLEHVGAAGLARHRAIAVFDHVDAAGRGQQRRAGGEIEAARGIAARAHDVDGARALRNRRLARERAHRAREAAHLVGGHALRTQRGQQRARERGRHVACRSARATGRRPRLRSATCRTADVRACRAGSLPAARHLQEVADELRAVGREHALGMELHAFDLERAGGARP